MKKYFIKTIQLIAIILIPFILSQCKDEDEIRFEMDDTISAVNFRVQRDASQFDASDPNAQVELTYYTENNDIAKVEVFAEYYSLLDDSTHYRYLVEELTSGFSNDGSHKNVLTLEEIKSTVGVSDLAGGDQLSLYHVVHLNDGRIYPDTINVGGTNYVNVESGIMVTNTSSFTPVLNFPVSCPIEDETFATGSYLFDVIEDGDYAGNNASPFGPLYGDGVVVNVTATSGTVRRFSVPYLYQAVAGFESPNFTFEFACNVVLVPTQSTGLGCSALGLYIAQNPSDIGTFDAADDGEFTIAVYHNVNGDCGLETGTPLKFRLTKQ